MKAERRHELQTNALAQWLAKTGEQVQPHINTILLIVIAVVAVIVAVVFLSGRGDGNAGLAWEKYYKAKGVDEVEQRILELRRVNEDHPGTPAGLWALVMAADEQLLRGTNNAFKDRTKGREDLENAESNFKAVIQGAEGLSKSQREMLLIRANWGLARTYESLAQYDDAIAQYDKLAEQWPKEPLGEAAADQAKYLKGMEEWFTWYAQVDPTQITPTPRQPPGGGMPFGHPQINPITPSFTPGSGDDGAGEIDLGSGLGTFPVTPDDSDPPGETAPPSGDSTESGGSEEPIESETVPPRR